MAEYSSAAIGSIVFLDAFLPQDGEALADLASQGVRDAISSARNRGETSLKPLPAAYFNVNEADRAWVDAKCTSHPILTFTDKAAITGARERLARKAYIRATGFSSTAFDAAYARARANSSWRAYEMPCGHDAMIDRPDRLVEILLEVSAA